ncbi:MAG: hypothetical protein A4S09_07330 [Proteobacteria bacterium SG_bin7]|nr:MAG: hypothetical protein A4S09_07330 [Proteobacteria bacterium SG_bin7]
MPKTLHKSYPLLEGELVRKLIMDVGLPLNRAPDALGLTPKEFLRWWSNSSRVKLPRRAMTSLASFLKIDEKQIAEQNYSKENIRTTLFGGSYILPERYSVNRFSHLRSSAHIAKYISLTRGQHFCDKIMTSLGVPLLLYRDLEETISLNYFIDLLDILGKNGFSENELESLACLLFLGIENTDLGKKFSAARSYAECYDVLAKNIYSFDSNFIYASDLDTTRYILKAYLPYDRHYHFNIDHEHVTRLFRYRQTLIGWFPYLARLVPIRPMVQIDYLTTGIEATYVVKFSHLIITKPPEGSAIVERQIPLS